MAREVPRTLQGLARNYQHKAENLEYEVLLIDNGSPQPLDEQSWAHIDVPVRLIRIDNAHSSPAQATNLGLREARGEIVCLMMDAAHLLTPGVFRMALGAYQAFGNAVVATRYFYLGQEEQPVAVTKGYNQAEEDQLLERINWPHDDGYRLFEIATPLSVGVLVMNWLNRVFESNCLFMRREVFQAMGGADERFDLPAGGFVNLDIFKRAVDSPGVTPVQLIGEGCFHQLHGGTTTNTSGKARQKKLQEYRRQYEEIRGTSKLMTDKGFMYLGHMPTKMSNITIVTRRRAKIGGLLAD